MQRSATLTPPGSAGHHARRWSAALLAAVLVLAAQVVVARPAEAAKVAKVTMSVSSTRLQLGEAVWPRAVVADSAGKPVAGVKVALQRRAGSGSWSTFSTRTTGVSGIAQFPNRPGKAYQYRALVLDGSKRTSSAATVRVATNLDRTLAQRAKQLSRQLGASKGSAVRSGTTTAQRYQHGMLVSYGATGKRRTWLVHGKMMTKYVELGGITGKLGRPIQDVRCSLLDSGCIQRFQGGTLYYSSAAPSVTVAYGSGRWTEHAAVALSQVGYKEPSWRVNKYNAWLGTNVAWCGVFQSWVSSASGNGSAVPHSRSFRALVNDVKKRGMVTSKPAPGRLVFFGYDPSSPRTPTHVGLIIAVRSNGSLVTVEGNTTATGGFTDKRVVAQRTRSQSRALFYASIH